MIYAYVPAFLVCYFVKVDIVINEFLSEMKEPKLYESGGVL